jgi:hypothetical protein
MTVSITSTNTCRVLVIAVGLFLFSAPTWASGVVLGQSCGTLGVTQMSDDHQSILACLEDANHTLSWRASYTPPTCNPGELLTTDNKGTPKCATLQCHVVSATPTDSAPGKWVQVYCPQDEFVMNGGGWAVDQCPNEFGFIHTNSPINSGYGAGWVIDAFGAKGATVDDTGQDVCATSQVTCCKFVQTP